MNRKAQAITEAELSVLKTLWERGPLTARLMTEAIYPQCSDSDLATVHSLLQRLEQKDLIARDRSRHAHLFSAAVTHWVLEANLETGKCQCNS